MHCVDAINDEVKFKYIKICEVLKFNGKHSLAIWPVIQEFDLNNNNFNEIVFSTNVGFETRPRQFFAYYPQLDTLYKSEESYAAFFNPFAFDLDNDNNPDFFASSCAYGNCRINRNYSDNYCWIMGFNKKMQFIFPPIAIDKYSATTTVQPISFNSTNYLLCLHRFLSKGDTPCFISLINKKGKTIKKRTLDCNHNNLTPLLFSTNNSDCFSIGKNHIVYSIDSNLNFKKYKKYRGFKFNTDDTFTKIDIDNNDQNEFLFKSSDSKKLLLLDNNLNYISELEFPEEIRKYNASVIFTKGKSVKIFIDNDKFSYTFSLGKSFIYNYWYLIAFVIFIVFYIFLVSLKKVKEYRQLKHDYIKNKITELQIKSFQNQIDPHFTFNLLESFGSLIHEQNVEKANFIFNNYAKLLKSTLINSDKVFIPLKEELSFVRSFLDLEMFRFNNKFTYDIHVNGEEINMIIIPKMLIHIFAENAIKHGIKHLECKGKLDIRSFRKNGSYIIQINDNGIGRKKAKEYSSFSSGTGLNSINQILDLYFNLYKINIDYTINDLEQGTQVEINIPLKD